MAEGQGLWAFSASIVSAEKEMNAVALRAQQLKKTLSNRRAFTAKEESIYKTNTKKTESMTEYKNATQMTTENVFRGR